MGDVVGGILDPTGLLRQAAAPPKMPDPPKMRVEDPEEAARAAEERKRRKMRKSGSGMGHSDTDLTSGGALPGAGQLAVQSLLGA